MSMNLHCKEMDLYQTPTHITYMCFSNNDGGFRGILYRYSEWVMSLGNGVYDSSEDARAAREPLVEHVKALKAFKQLHFYIM